MIKLQRKRLATVGLGVLAGGVITFAATPRAFAAHGAGTASRSIRQHARKHHHPRRFVVHFKKGGRGGDPGNDYPAVWQNAPMDYYVDNWGELTRECTSFVAFALYTRNGFTMPFHGNAINWGPDAEARGYTVNSTPAAGSVAWSTKPPLGHVAYVESVEGSNVTIEEYNHYGNGTYDARTVPASTFTGYIHFKDVSSPAPPNQGGGNAGGGTTIQGGPGSGVQNPGGGTQQGSNPVIQGGGNAGGGGASPTYAETVGGVTHTWTDQNDAGGSEGPSIPAYATIQVSCRTQGLAVADGNTWWYKIASGPWSNNYWMSADAAYNEAGVTSGSLHGTPFVDPNVPVC
jgi:surface antigen